MHHESARTEKREKAVMNPGFFSFYHFYAADLLMIPAMLFALWAQMKVKSTYKNYARVTVRSGITGAQIAQRMMRDANLDTGRGTDAPPVGLECIDGVMTDHYDPTAHTVRLSKDVYHGCSVAALGIAAHEVGHAIQHANGYTPLSIRNYMYPISSIGSKLAWPIIIFGIILGMGPDWLVSLGLWLFSASVAFTIVTLPVEFDASKRAVRALADGGVMTAEELDGTRSVLNAAALTYVAAAASAILMLIRLIIIARGRD
jgi:Zn-dependent membrane protease YugP